MFNTSQTEAIERTAVFLKAAGYLKVSGKAGEK